MWWGIFSPLFPESPARLYIVGAFVALVGAGLAIFGGTEAHRVSKTKAWPAADGTLDISQVQDVSTSRGGPRFKLRVAYHFEVAGKPFHGDRLTPLGAPQESEAEAISRALAHPPGQPCRVFYNPADPKENCLEPGATGKAWMWLWMGVVMFVLGSLPVASLFFVPAPKD
ncbi:MAG: hypothetical protein FD180_3430 [Planctomycetota bacterium]|nr:MAG: hypothetical protein FD180_3430 [Planctomycetota bacterium]